MAGLGIEECDKGPGPSVWPSSMDISSEGVRWPAVEVRPGNSAAIARRLSGSGALSW